jgi:5-methylcytosine-specific restriction enzyme A
MGARRKPARALKRVDPMSTAHPAYGKAHWRKRARLQLQAEPLCAICLTKGRVTPAEVADHIEPHRGDSNAFHYGELQSLCARCHNTTKHRQEEHERRHGYRKGYDESGWPIDPRHPVYR